MSYNMTWVDSANTLYDVFSGVNTNSNSAVMMLFVALFFFAIFSVSKTYGTVVALITSSWVTTIIASLLFFAGLIAWYVAIIPILLLVTGIIIKGFE